MSRIQFRETGEEHNFWQNYTDLMSGFLIVFIIASLVAYGSYKVYVDLYHSKGITEGNINDIVVNAELYKKIREFQDAQKLLAGNISGTTKSFNDLNVSSMSCLHQKVQLFLRHFIIN